MKNKYFADTYYYLALLNPNDRCHLRAVEFAKKVSGVIVTTDLVLVELADALCAPRHRVNTANYINSLLTGEDVEVFSLNRSLLLAGLSLYQDRPDKEWSLTDCISFIVMERESIEEALTGDRHFEQAGFKAALAQ